ncbi:hypothetical protein, partial [Thermoleptolyngbya sp.]
GNSVEQLAERFGSRHSKGLEGRGKREEGKGKREKGSREEDSFFIFHFSFFVLRSSFFVFPSPLTSTLQVSKPSLAACWQLWGDRPASNFSGEASSLD